MSHPPGPLMVLVEDALSSLAAKGELTPRYYNPGGLFSEVHLVGVNYDTPPVALLQSTVGDAKLVYHPLPPPSHVVLRSAAWRLGALGDFARRAVLLALDISPALVRVHGNHVGAFAASWIKRELGVPYVVSLHTNPDEDWGGPRSSFRDRTTAFAFRSLWRNNLLGANLVLPVYEPIVPHLKALGVLNYEVAYNVINPIHLAHKTTYALHHPARILSVGRQFADKDPSNLIRAMAKLPEATLTVVGDGSHHEHLKEVARSEGVAERVAFHRAVPNAELCAVLAEHDIFATHTNYWEISKSVLEALLTGLPVVLNRRPGAPVPELGGGIVCFCDNSVQGYAGALRRLLESDSSREALGRRGFEAARRRWNPELTEKHFVDVYRRVMRA